MHPILFEAGSIKLYSYGVMIMIGAIAAFAYMCVQARKQYGMSFEQSNSLLLYVLLAAVIGGKLLVIFEEPSRYLSNPSALLSPSGFVFYGSLLAAIPVMLWFFRKEKLPALGMLDIMAVTACIVHMLGRLGCFLAGCCYGLPTDGRLAVSFQHPQTMARPVDVPLHPTQLYDSAQIFIIMIFLLWLKRHKRFDGQMFLLYLMLYALGRSIIEEFRGDGVRGFVIDAWLSNAQFVSVVILIAAGCSYLTLSKRTAAIKQGGDQA